MRFLPEILRADLVRYFVIAFVLGVGITALFGALILGNDFLQDEDEEEQKPTISKKNIFVQKTRRSTGLTSTSRNVC